MQQPFIGDLTYGRAGDHSDMRAVVGGLRAGAWAGAKLFIPRMPHKYQPWWWFLCRKYLCTRPYSVQTREICNLAWRGSVEPPCEETKQRAEVESFSRMKSLSPAPLFLLLAGCLLLHSHPAEAGWWPSAKGRALNQVGSLTSPSSTQIRYKN
jgi:hypothetical protein